MNDVNINQLQFNELKHGSNFQKGGAILSPESRDELMHKTRSFLANRSRLIITNRKQVNAQKDGYFVLEISQKGYRLIRSQSVRRSEYTYSFKHNVFKLNGRPIDPSFLVQFMNYFDTITNRLSIDDYEMIEGDII